MTTLQLFNYGGQEVRTVTVDGEPIFAGMDVAAVVGISKYRDAMAQLDDDERVSMTVDTLGGQQSISGVTESGVYSLMLISRSPKVKAFKRWLTHEVLPAIRKTGHYGVPALDLNAIDPRTLALAILEESDRANAAESKVLELAPKAEAFEHFMEADGSLSIGAVANMYKVGRQTLFDWLRAAKVVQGDRRPYQEYAHWFDVKATTFERSSGAAGVSYSAKVLPSGVDPLFRLLVRRGYITPAVSA